MQKTATPQNPVSSSRNAVSFSSARTTNRFPSSRCASAIQIVRPLESTAETQPQLQLALLEIVGLLIADHYLRCRFARFKLGAHFLDERCLLPQTCSEPRNFLLLFRDGGSQFLHFAMLFQKLI
jgi:hypothetical protein